MVEAQLRYQGTVDTSQIPALEFPIGSWAYVKVQFFRTTCPSKKLADKFLGLYKVIVQPGTHSVTLHLPDSLRTVHPMFHVSMLEPATLNAIPDQVQPPLPPIFVDGEPEYEIAKVLDSKMDNRCSKCKLLYLVHWTGYASTDKETHGSWHRNSKMHPNSSRTSISRIRPSWVPSDNFKAICSRLSPPPAGARGINHLRNLGVTPFF